MFGFLICWYCVAFFRLYDLFVVDCCVGVLLLWVVGYLFGEGGWVSLRWFEFTAVVVGLWLILGGLVLDFGWLMVLISSLRRFGCCVCCVG